MNSPGVVSEMRMNRCFLWLVACALVGFALSVWTATGWAAPQGQEGSPAAERPAAAGQPADSPANMTTGSGKRFQTIVDRKTEGELSPEDFRQVSLLASRIVVHLGHAASHLLDDRTEEARAELEKARTLVGVVREMLPTTTVTTVVRDADGKEVYRYVDKVQDDRIPLFQELIAVNILEPITEAKREAAELEGLRLADADLVHTSVLLELDFLEGKLNRAMKLVEQKEGTEEALTQLRLAQTQGVTFVLNKQDNPLIDAQMALQFAERMVEQQRYEAARANLQLAKNNLALYRSLIGKSEGEPVGKLEQEITQLQAQIDAKDAVERIRDFWNRVTGLFSRQPGEMRETAGRVDQGETLRR